MKKIINKLISKIKGENYKLDDNIPAFYLYGYLINKFKMLMRGTFKSILFKKKGKHIFMGKRVTLKCKRKVSCGNGLTIGDNSYIDALSLEGIKIGNNVSFGRNTTIECTGVLRELGQKLIIEDGVGIAANAFIAVRGNVLIGKNTIIGPYFKLHSENHNFSEINIPIRKQGATRIGVEIKEDCWIGSNVTILDGVKLGKGCIVAAGAVVTKSFKDYSIIGGVPAKLIKSRIEEN